MLRCPANEVGDQLWDQADFTRSSTAVFAIALTLLVLDLPKPAHSAQLVHDLLIAWPSYVAYLVSFITIGILWIEHHGMMSAVRGINRRFLERTLVFLLFISIIPWPTALAADYANQSVPEARAAAVLYAATMLMMGLTFAWGWRYLAAHPELVAEPARPAFPLGRAGRCSAAWSTSSLSPWPSSAPGPHSRSTPSWPCTLPPPGAGSPA